MCLISTKGLDNIILISYSPFMKEIIHKIARDPDFVHSNEFEILLRIAVSESCEAIEGLREALIEVSRALQITIVDISFGKGLSEIIADQETLHKEFELLIGYLKDSNNNNNRFSIGSMPVKKMNPKMIPRQKMNHRIRSVLKSTKPNRRSSDRYLENNWGFKKCLNT